MVTFFLVKIISFYTVLITNVVKKRKFVQFYIKASPFQKWTFINVQNPKKL